MDEIEADYRAWTHMRGALSVDEFHFLEIGTSACSIRALDIGQSCWSIYWVTNTSGTLGEPVRGGWSSDRGEFYSDELLDGRRITVRFIWERLAPDVAHWQQAFKLHDFGDWEVNWTMDFRRSGGSSVASPWPP